VVELARGADVLLAEATYTDQVPPSSRPYLSSAREAGRQATDALADRLVLTHLWPGTDRSAALRAARQEYDGHIDVASAGLVVGLR
jgi:ribonuclease BN (tRNA processing enzyme)